MPPSKKEVEKLVEAWRVGIAGDLGAEAGASFAAGDNIAQGLIGIQLSPAFVDPDVLAFATKYQRMLTDEGASIINGKKVPWLRDYAKRTRKEINDVIAQGIKDGKGPIGKDSISSDLKEILGDKKTFELNRIARSESARIQNHGTINRYAKQGLSQVLVLDNEGPHSCQACRDANGQIWTLEKATQNTTQHPNCVRSFAGHGKIDPTALNDTKILAADNATIIKSTSGKLTRIAAKNAALRDGLRHSLGVGDPRKSYKRITGKELSESVEAQVKTEFNNNFVNGVRFISEKEIGFLGDAGNKIALDIAKEKTLTRELTKLTTKQDEFMNFLAARGVGTQSYAKTVGKLDRRVLGKGLEQMYVTDAWGNIKLSKSARDALDNTFAKSFKADGGTLVFNAVDANAAMPVDYVVIAARADISDIRMIVEARGTTFRTASRSININIPDGVSMRGLRTNYRNTEERLIKEGNFRADLIPQKTWQFVARDMGFEYDEVVI
ncbi:MAG: hypothetical protein KAJ03_01840 [Gammaproteobacteria bacterium]|nr:hypothetical protein [Gammaproteobacteria bacterium]